MICGFCGHEASGSTVNISEDEVQLRERDASIGWLGRPPRAKVFVLSLLQNSLSFLCRPSIPPNALVTRAVVRVILSFGAIRNLSFAGTFFNFCGAITYQTATIRPWQHAGVKITSTKRQLVATPSGCVKCVSFRLQQ